MTLDQKKIREIARVCSTLSKSAPTAEGHDIFANLTLKWVTMALDRLESQLVWTVFEDDGGAPSVSVTAEGPSF
jgi:hypothetical protein